MTEGDKTKKETNCKILSCDCECPQQDKIYGKGKRVHNKMKDDSWRCTCCQKEKK